MSEHFYMGADAEFGWFGSHIGHFFSNAAKVAGKGIGSVTHAVSSATGAVGKAVGKIPVVGAPVNTIFSAAHRAVMAPLENTVNAAIHGKNIGKAALDTLHEELHSVKAVAPYAKMVMSAVPGIGTGVNAALGAGLALASGQRIDKALLAGAVDAIPGGALAKAAASAAVAGVHAAATGQKLDINSTLLNSLPIPPAAKEALALSSHAVGALASGKPPPAGSEAIVKKALATLPPDARKAYQAGLALASAQVVQDKHVAELDSPEVRNKLTEAGIQAAKTVPAYGEARKLAAKGVRGFDLALGLLAQHAKPIDIEHLRKTLSPQDLMGFDMAMAVKIGLVTQPARGKLSPAAQAGRAIIQGIQGMPNPQNKQTIMAAVTAHPSAAVGAAEAVKQITIAREGFFTKAAHALGFDLGHKH